ncbi:MAG: D-amino acid dehydrogenase [Rhodobacteraceae bacterium]|nr:D-amino acid dehydrogenase [Paracoccaceae bacterium]
MSQHIVVLGAGVVGTTTAFALAADGHRVTVIDRQPGPGLETSFANGAQISACHVKPWAEPGAPWQALKWMFQADAPLLIKPFRWDPDLWRWGLRFLTKCTAAQARESMNRALRIAIYSRSVLGAWRQQTNIQYDQVLRGILHIYRSPAEFEKGKALAARLSEFGLRQDILDPDACVACEPALAHLATRDLVGGILSPEDESGDAHRFTAELAKLAQARNVTFRFGETVKTIDRDGKRICGISTDRGYVEGDAVVLALGSFSPRLTRELGLNLPVYPAKGYSITAHVTKSDAAPTVSILDEARYMVFSRLGDRLRVAGTVELGGWSMDLDPVRVKPLLDNARETFPEASDYGEVAPWCGLRPATPDSLPIVGATSFENLFLNTGHGTLGWTMACGSAKVIADLIAGRQPEIDLEGLGIARFA